MFFNFIQMENRMYYMLLDFIHFDKMGVKMVFHVIIQPQRFNLVFDFRGREMVFKSRRYFRWQLVGITTVAQKLVGIKLDIFGTSKN